MEATASRTAGRKKSVHWNLPPSVQPPTTLERVFHQRLVSRSVRYLTSGRQLASGRARDVASEPPPFHAPQQEDVIASGRHKRELPARDKHTHRSRQRVDLLERLHVVDSEAGDVADLDQRLLRIVERRPIRERQDLRRYVDDVRRNLVGRLGAGWRRDEALRLDVQVARGRCELEAARCELRSYSHSFDEMTARNHEESMAVLRRHEQSAGQLEAVIQHHAELQRRLSAVRARLYVLGERWAACKLHQAFLHQASPVTWRQQHGILVSDVDSGPTERHASTSLPDEDSLEVLISQFSADVTTESQLQLYFSEPQQLLLIFSDMEHKNLDSLLHLESLSESLHHMRRVGTQVEQTFRNQVSSTSTTISEFTTAIEWEEARAAELESYARQLMSTTFKDLVESDDLLQLKVFVEDTYEAVIAKNESNLKMIDMKSAIEARYDQLMLQLEKYPRSTVHEVQRHVLATNERELRASRAAAVKAQLMQRLVRRLMKALEPPFVKVGKPVHFRSPPPKAKRKPKPKPAELTQKQKDFLQFFTEYCQYTDSVGMFIDGF